MECTTVETGDGAKLSVRLFKPAAREEAAEDVVVVHPYTILGGVQGLLRGIAEGLARRGHCSVTFDMRGAGRSTGRASLTGSSRSGTSSPCAAGSPKTSSRAPSSSSAPPPLLDYVWSCISLYWPQSYSGVDKVDHVVGYVSIGYPFGLMASILFGSHYDAILKSEKPKLIIMGSKDGFTSVKQLQNKLKSAAGRADTHLIEGAGHLQMEGPAFDAQMVDLIVNFIKSLPKYHGL